MLLDQLVNLRMPVYRHLEKIVGKAARFFIHVSAFRPERFAHVFRRLLAHVPLKEHLQAKLAGFAPVAHGLSRRGLLLLLRCSFLFRGMRVLWTAPGLALQTYHLHGGKRRFKALVSRLQSRALQGLIKIVTRQDSVGVGRSEEHTSE